MNRNAVIPHELATARQFGAIAMAGIAAFVAICTAAQVWRGDLDWLRAPLSFYLSGERGMLVQAAYFALGAALVLLGVGYYRGLRPAARSSAPLLLFVMGALALCITAVADSNMPDVAPTLEGFIHGMAAQTAFLCVTTAMLLQSWRMRGDAEWRHRFGLAFALAVICFIALWTHALWRDAPRGLTQKVVVVLIAAWLGLAAAWLRRPVTRVTSEASGVS